VASGRVIARPKGLFSLHGPANGLHYDLQGGAAGLKTAVLVGSPQRDSAEGQVVENSAFYSARESPIRSGLPATVTNAFSSRFCHNRNDLPGGDLDL